MKDKVVVIITTIDFANQTIKTYNLDHMTSDDLIEYRKVITRMLKNA